MGHHGDHAGGHKHEADGEQRDRAQICPKVSPVSKDSRDVEQRWQEEEEHQIRLELDPREARYEAEDQPAEYQQDRVGDHDLIGEGRERGHRDEQDEDCLYLKQGGRALSVER